MVKATVIKAFSNKGVAYNVGDSFVGPEAQIKFLEATGYVKAENVAEKPKRKTSKKEV